MSPSRKQEAVFLITTSSFPPHHPFLCHVLIKQKGRNVMCTGNSTGLPSGTFRILTTCGPCHLLHPSHSLSLRQLPSLSPWGHPLFFTPPHSLSLPLLQSYTIHVVWCHNFIYHNRLSSLTEIHVLQVEVCANTSDLLFFSF